jgi:hypothetical protein
MIYNNNSNNSLLNAGGWKGKRVSESDTVLLGILGAGGGRSNGTGAGIM